MKKRVWSILAALSLLVTATDGYGKAQVYAADNGNYADSSGFSEEYSEDDWWNWDDEEEDWETEEPTPVPTIGPPPIVPPTVTESPTATPMPTVTPTARPTLEPDVRPTATPVPTVTPTPGSNTLEELEEVYCVVDHIKTPSSGIQKAAVKVSWWKITSAWKYQIYRAEGTGKSKLLATCDVSKTSYVDKTVKKGRSYSYKIRAFGGTPTDSYTGPFSNEEWTTVPSSLTNPVIRCQKSGKKLKIIFAKAEGTFYQMQYRYVGGKWQTRKKEKIKKSVTKPFKAVKKTFLMIRVRTVMQVNGKMAHSKWSSAVTIKT